MRTNHGVFLPLALLLAAATAGCASKQTSGWDATSNPPSSISVRVDNLNFNEATLWHVSSRGRQRLGIAPGNGVTTLTAPWTFSDRLQLEIDLLAGPRCTTDAIMADPGDEIELRIEAGLGSIAGCR